MTIELACWTSAFGAVLLVAGCSAENPTNTSTDPATDPASGEVATVGPFPLRTVTPVPAAIQRFVSIRRDERRCPSPACGGYFVRELNVGTSETYVWTIDFATSATFDPALVLAAPADEIVLKGSFGEADPRTHAFPFVVTEGYRGMPGVDRCAENGFYKMAVGEPSFAVVLNEPNTPLLRVQNVYVVDVLRPWVDGMWLQDRVLDDGAIVAASMRDGWLVASQVFVRLPDRVGPCPAWPRWECGNGTAPVYMRNEDRCLLQIGCAERGICPLYAPSCEAGYRLASWPVPPHACAKYACDPSFTLSQ